MKQREISHIIVFLGVLLTFSFFAQTALADSILPEEKEWTLMIYLDADNNLNDDAWRNLAEMEYAGNNEQLNVVLLVDNYRDHNSSYQILEGHKIKEVLDLGEVNMGDPQTLTDFVTWAEENYPAKKYALDFWDHGGGFLNWGDRADVLDGLLQAQDVCWDDTNDDDALSMGEIRYALTDHHFELLAFDCCLMGQLEVAYELKDIGNIFLGSQESMWGFSYVEILNLLNETPNLSAEDWAAGIVDVYVDYYRQQMGENDLGCGITLSALRLDQLDEMMIPLNQLAPLLSSAIPDYIYEIEKANQETLCFEEKSYVDLYDFTKKLDHYLTDAEIPGIEALTQAIRTGIDQAIIKNGVYTNYTENAHGISIWNLWRTYSLYDYQLGKMQYDRLLFAEDSQWDDYLYQFMGKRNEVSIPDPLLNAAVRETLDLEIDEPVKWSDWSKLDIFQSNNAGIQNLRGIEQADRLSNLNLSDNQIEDLKPISALTYLERLWLANNRIKDLTHLINSKYIDYLVLTDNQISTIEPLREMTESSKYLEVVDLRGNPLDLSPGSPAVETIRFLEAQGAEVRYDGQLPPEGDFTQWETSLQVNSTHDFEIQFNMPVTLKTINESIFVINETFAPVSQTIALKEGDDHTVMVYAPAAGYGTGTYYLYIKNDITSQTGNVLKQGVYMPFTTF